MFDFLFKQEFKFGICHASAYVSISQKKSWNDAGKGLVGEQQLGKTSAICQARSGRGQAQSGRWWKGL